MEREKLINLSQKGFTYKEIGELFGISKQRVHQIIRGYSSYKKVKGFDDSLLFVKHKLKPKITNPIKMGQLDRIRELVRIRDNRTCQICNKVWKPGTRRLDVHHLDENKQQSRDCRWDSQNMDRLITLCHKCHFSLDSFKNKKRNKKLST